MHTCTNCAHQAVVGGEAAGLCTHCGVVSANIAEASASPMLMAALLAVGVAGLAFAGYRLVKQARSSRPVVA